MTATKLVTSVWRKHRARRMGSGFPRASRYTSQERKERGQSWRDMGSISFWIYQNPDCVRSWREGELPETRGGPTTTSCPRALPHNRIQEQSGKQTEREQQVRHGETQRVGCPGSHEEAVQQGGAVLDVANEHSKCWKLATGFSNAKSNSDLEGSSCRLALAERNMKGKICNRVYGKSPEKFSYRERKNSGVVAECWRGMGEGFVPPWRKQHVYVVTAKVRHGGRSWQSRGDTELQCHGRKQARLGVIQSARGVAGSFRSTGMRQQLQTSTCGRCMRQWELVGMFPWLQSTWENGQ